MDESKAARNRLSETLSTLNPGAGKVDEGGPAKKKSQWVVFQKPIGAQGLEPWQTDSESVVLPLHHAPVTKEYRESIRSSSCIA